MQAQSPAFDAFLIKGGPAFYARIARLVLLDLQVLLMILAVLSLLKTQKKSLPLHLLTEKIEIEQHEY